MATFDAKGWPARLRDRRAPGPRSLNSASEGLISALRETTKGAIIPTSAPVSPGSSGGGLFNSSAQLVGIVTFQRKSGQNLNFALPATWISDMSNRDSSNGLFLGGH